MPEYVVMPGISAGTGNLSISSDQEYGDGNDISPDSRAVFVICLFFLIQATDGLSTFTSKSRYLISHSGLPASLPLSSSLMGSSPSLC